MGGAAAGRLARISRQAERLQQAGRYGEAEPLLREEVRLAEASAGRKHLHFAAALHNLAALYQRKGEVARPARLLRQSLAIQQEARGGDHPEVALTLHSIAILHKVQGRYREARPLYERSIDLLLRSLGRMHPHVSTAMANYARFLREEADHFEEQSRRIDLSLAEISDPAARAKMVINQRAARSVSPFAPRVSTASGLSPPSAFRRAGK